MNIKDVCIEFDISADTLRYYERIGVIPPVNRTSGGIRDYTEDDLKWVKQAVCFRNAGLSVDALVEYRKLFEQGDETITDRLNLLESERDKAIELKNSIDEALNRLNRKISIYERAVKTGVLSWDTQSPESINKESEESK